MSKIKWIERGNSCTKEFCKVVRKKKTRVMVTSLKKVDGEMASSQEEIKETCKAFYCNMYSTPPKSPHVIISQCKMVF
jgi:hypothetical protein